MTQDKFSGENAFSPPAEGYAELDARGLLCPEPVMMLHNKVKTVDAGCLIKVLATDASTLRDIPRFCEFLRHPLMHSETQGADDKQEYVFWVQRRLETK